MTDLSKELGEIKAKYGFYPNIVHALRAQSEAEDHRGAGGLCRDAADRMERLLHIIEVEIPGMLRARAKELDKLPDGPYDDGRLQGGTDELCAAALFIESLTKDNEKENG